MALPPFAQTLAQHGSNALTGLSRALSRQARGVAKRTVLAQLFVTLVPALFIAALLAITYRVATAPEAEVDTAGLSRRPASAAADVKEEPAGLIGAQEPEKEESGTKEPPAEGAKEAAPAEAKTGEGAKESQGAAPTVEEKPAATPPRKPGGCPCPSGCGSCSASASQ